MTNSDFTSRSSTTFMSCGVCGCNSMRPLFGEPDFDGNPMDYVLHRCRECHSVQTVPRPSAQQLIDAYDANYYGDKNSKFNQLIEYWTKASARRRARQLLDMHGSENRKLRVLDFGCGRGVLLNAFDDLGHAVIGVEQSDSPFEGEPNVRCGKIDELNLVPGTYDIIVLWHVLEHLEEPRKIMMKLEKLLINSGSLFLSVPNFGSYQSRIFKGAWFHLDLPRHLYHFDYESLQYLLADGGFEIRDKTSYSLDQNLFGFVQSTLNTLPGIKRNQFYVLLKSDVSAKVLFGLLLYMPLVAVVAFVGLFELLGSLIMGRGATLSVRAIKKAP